MQRRHFLKFSGLAILGMGKLESFLSVGGKRPNVILVMTDDQGYGDLGCHGNPYLKTPNLDKFYEESVRLTNFHVSPTCSPTRAALMTGKYNLRTGVWHTVMGRSFLRRDERTMADAFKDKGYNTAIFGKWHLGDNYPYRPGDRGFDEVLIHGGGGVGQTPDYWGNDYFDDTYQHNGNWEKFSGYCTDVWFDEAIKYIERKKDENFFVYLPTNAPHSPLYVNEKYWKPYKEMGLDKNVARYYGMVENIDNNFGKLVAKLDELELAEDTILMFTSDNGASGKTIKYTAGFRGWKGSPLDYGHRVPFFIRWPKGIETKGTDIDTLSAHIDLLPTLVGICGLEDGGVEFDGVNLWPLIRKGESRKLDRYIVVDSQRLEQPLKWRNSSVMTQRYRLIRGEKLYDMKNDPMQKKDISSEKPVIVEKLKGYYEKWWKNVSERFDEYCPIVIESKSEDPACITAMDWHAPIEQIPWNQNHIKNALKGNGYWVIEPVKTGNYEFELRRWPRELNMPINSTPEGAKAVRVKNAKIKVGDKVVEKKVKNGDKAVSFKISLQKGQMKMQTWFLGSEDEGNRGAYYVYVRKL